MNIPTSTTEWLVSLLLLAVALLAFVFFRKLFVQQTESNGKVTTRIRLNRSSLPRLPSLLLLKTFIPKLHKPAKPSARRLKAYAQLYQYQSTIAAIALYVFGLCLLFMAVQSLVYSSDAQTLINALIRFLAGIAAIALSIMAFNSSRKNNPFKS